MLLHKWIFSVRKLKYICARGAKLSVSTDHDIAVIHVVSVFFPKGDQEGLASDLKAGSPVPTSPHPSYAPTYILQEYVPSILLTPSWILTKPKYM